MEWPFRWSALEGVNIGGSWRWCSTETKKGLCVYVESTLLNLQHRQPVSSGYGSSSRLDQQ